MLIRQSHRTMPRDASNLLSLASISFPLIALVVTFSIDAVGDGDSIPYRGFVGGFSVIAITSGGIATILALFGYYIDQHLSIVVRYVGVSFFFTAALSLSVVLTEVTRGVEDDWEAIKILLIVLACLGVLELVFRMSGLG